MAKLLHCLILLTAFGLLLFDGESAWLSLVLNPFGAFGLAIGVAAIAIAGIRGRGMIVLTSTGLALTVGLVLLYRLFLYVFQQSIADTWPLPSYLPARWFTVVSAFGVGVLLGAALPFMLFLLVSEGFRFLGQTED